jgi:hypothetical protein
MTQILLPNLEVRFGVLEHDSITRRCPSDSSSELVESLVARSVLLLANNLVVTTHRSDNSNSITMQRHATITTLANS